MSTVQPKSRTSKPRSTKKSSPRTSKPTAKPAQPKPRALDGGHQARAKGFTSPPNSGVSSEEWAGVLIDLWRVHERAAAASKAAGGHPYMTAISAAVVGLSLAAQKAADEVTFTVLAAHALDSQARGVAFAHLTGDVRAVATGIRAAKAVANG